MDRMPLIGVLFVSVPEEIMLSALGLALVGIRLNWRLLVMAGAIEAALSYLVRLAPMPFGVHTLVQVVLFALVLTAITRHSYKITFIAMLISTAIYGAVEGTTITFILHATGLGLQDVWTNPWTRVAFFVPQGLITLAILVVCRLRNFKLLDYPALTGNESNDRGWRDERL